VVREGFWQEGKRISWKDEVAAGNDAAAAIAADQ
jgi:hypothetical protein